MIEPALLIALEYAAPAECPNVDRFWQSVGRSAPHVQLAGSNSPRRRYSVAVNASGEGFLGELREEGQPVPRTLAAADCRELVEALALMLALSTEQEALVREPATERADPEPAATQEVQQAVREPPSRVVAVVHSKQEHATAPPPPSAVTKRTAVMLGGFVWFGAGPDPLLGVAVNVEHGIGPVIVLRFEARGAMASKRADANFLGFSPQACASTRQPVAALAVCAGAVLGMLQVNGVEYSGLVSGRQSSGWVAPLLAARATKSFDGSLAIELTTEGQHGLIERSYHVKSDNTEFTTAPIAALIMLAVGAQF